jgi:hypothetical protein
MNTNANIEKKSVVKKQEVKAKSVRKKRAAMSDFDELDGKSRDLGAEDKSLPQSLDEFLGYRAPNPYKTNSKEEYLSKLRLMNLTDMQAHAYTVGLKMPLYNRAELMKELIASFCRYHGMEEARAKKVSGENNVGKLSPLAQQILSQGK